MKTAKRFYLSITALACAIFLFQGVTLADSMSAIERLLRRMQLKNEQTGRENADTLKKMEAEQSEVGKSNLKAGSGIRELKIREPKIREPKMRFMQRQLRMGSPSRLGDRIRVKGFSE